MVNLKDLHFKDFASVAIWGCVAGNCPPRNSSLSTLISNGANDVSQTPAPLNGKGYIFGCGGVWHQHAGNWWINLSETRKGVPELRGPAAVCLSA